MMPMYVVSLAVVLIILWMDVGTQSKAPEPFEPQPETMAMSLMNTLQKRGIQFAPGGLRRIAITERSVGTTVQESMWTMLVGRQPAFFTTTTFRLVFETSGNDIIRSQVLTVRGVGESREESRRDSEVGVRQVIDAVRTLSRSRGYMT